MLWAAAPYRKASVSLTLSITYSLALIEVAMQNVSNTMCGVEVRDNRDLPFYIGVVGFAVTTIFMALRIFLIFTPGGKDPGWDDALVVLCWILALVPGVILAKLC